MKAPINSLVVTTGLLLFDLQLAAAGELYEAALARDVETVRALVDAQANVDEAGDLGTPLHVAGSTPLAVAWN